MSWILDLRAKHQYQVSQQIAQGSCAEIWSGVHLESGRRVAIKRVIGSVDSRLEREIGILQRLPNHPNLIEYFGSFRCATETLIGMELLDHDLTFFKKLSVSKAADVTLQASRGLQALHNIQVIHRDIKPQNILVRAGAVRLADFGISKIVKKDEMLPYRGGSVGIGTVPYMSPEIAFKNRYGVGTDVWSLGCVFFELMQNKPLIRVLETCCSETRFLSQQCAQLQMLFRRESVLSCVDPRARPALSCALNVDPLRSLATFSSLLRCVSQRKKND